MFLVFRGNDLHSGFAPSKVALDNEAIDALQQVYDSSVNRVFYVVFPNMNGSSRHSTMAISPPSHFGNQGAYVAHKAQSLNFSEHGQHILGTVDDAKNRLGRDFVRLFSNQLEVAGLRLKMPLNDLLDNITYQSENGEDVALMPQPYDIFKDADYIRTWRGYFQFHRQHCQDYLIRITKGQYQRMQKYLCSGQATEPHTSRSNFLTHRLPMAASSPLPMPHALPELSVSAVKSRSLSSGKVTLYPAFVILCSKL